MGMKQEGLLFLRKVMGGGGGWERECFACVDRKMQPTQKRKLQPKEKEMAIMLKKKIYTAKS